MYQAGTLSPPQHKTVSLGMTDRLLLSWELSCDIVAPKQNEYKPKLNEMNVSLLYPLPPVGRQLPDCQAKIELSFAKKEKLAPMCCL